MARLGDYIEQIRGVSYKPEDICTSTDKDAVAILRANNIQDDGLTFNNLVYVKRSKISDKQYIKKGDIVVCASSGSKNLVGKAAMANENMPVSFGAFCKVVRSQKLISSYLGYFFQSPKYRSTISKLSGGANINNIRNEHIDELDIIFVSEVEQERIVNELNKISNLISLRKQQLSKLDELVKSRFIEMFGDCDLSHSHNDWRLIIEIGRVIGGATPKTNIDEYWNGEYRWITPAELDADSGYIYDSVRKLTKAGVESCSLQEMPINTVILTSRAPIGKLAIAGDTFYCNQGFKNIICKEEIIPIYLYTLLLMNTEYLNSLGRGATFKEISKSILENIKIPVPPIEQQNKFAVFVEQIDKSKFEIKKSLEKLETLKKALMQKYFG